MKSQPWIQLNMNEIISNKVEPHAEVDAVQIYFFVNVIFTAERCDTINM